MPPVKRTRSTRASTRAAKTARAPSRPAAPQEQAINPPPASTENAGMVNVNIEALTATLSAAVQQAVHSALTTASTSNGSPELGDNVAQVPGVQENLVSRMVETEVTALTNAGVACFARLVIYRPPPAVSGTASAPLPLWVPSQCLLGDIAVCFPEGVPNPTPLSPSYLDVDPFLLSCCPKLFICYDLWPVDAHDGSQAFVDKGLQFGGVRFCYSPRSYIKTFFCDLL
ncbi:hypothetical protein ACROYT_G005351 [Oculina patagonica]